MIVEPQVSGRLVVWIVVIAVVRWIHIDVGIGEPRFGVSVELRQHLCSMQVNDSLDLRDVGGGPVNSEIDRLWKKMRRGQLIVPTPRDWIAAKGLNHHADEIPVV